MVDRAPILAEDVARKDFSRSFRGFDQYSVRAYLGQVAAELAVSQEREVSLRERLAAAEARAVPPELGEAELSAALGAEAGRLLQAAREAASEIRSHAEEDVARMREQASADASSMRREAEGVLRARTEEAEQAAGAIRSEAEQAVAERRADADRQAREAVDEALARGRAMVAEAQAVRERVLRDMARRRRAASQQLEQLRVGRERLLESYRVVRANLDEATSELTGAEVEARSAAEAIGFAQTAAANVEEPTLEELEGEVAAAREAGLVVAPPSRPAVEVAPEPVETPPQIRAETEPEPAGVAYQDRPVPTERRTSALRILRRRQPSADPPLDEIDEGVRLLRAAPAEDEPAARGEVIDLTDPALVGHEATTVGVQRLFDRIRADRAAAVASAEALLAEPAEAVLAEPAEAVLTETAEPADRDGSSEPDIAVEPPPDEGLGTEGEEAVLQERDAEIEPVERTLGRAVKRALADEQNEVLDALRRLRTVPTVEALLPEQPAHAGRYLAVTGPRLEEAALLGGGHQQPPVDVTDLARDLAQELADALRARIGVAIAESGEDDIAHASESISAAYREWKTTKAEPLVRHHVAAAHVRGRFAALPEAALRWVMDDERGGCPDCSDNALAGPLDKGKPFPTGQQHPPAHIGCRCLIVPASG